MADEREKTALELVQQMVGALCDRPESCMVMACSKDNMTEFVITPRIDDVGKIMGPHGITLGAMRAYLAALGVKQGTRYKLTINQKQELFYLHRN